MPKIVESNLDASASDFKIQTFQTCNRNVSRQTRS